MRKKFKQIKYSEEEINFLKENYPKLGNKKCAEILGRSIMALNKKAKKLGLSPNWKYTYMSKEGYLVDCTKRDEKILVHRKIMEEHLGRKLTSDEIVHHKDGNKLNNSIDNLELLTRAEYINLHRAELVAAKSKI